MYPALECCGLKGAYVWLARVVGSPAVPLKWNDMAVLGRDERVNVICEIQIVSSRSLPGVLIAFLQKHSSAGVE